MKLSYVQIEANTVLIDTRVYCRDVIQVDHRLWMQDTLYKHQTVIEQYFGILRFQTAETGKRGQPEKYALLTESQCNFCLTLSRNSTEVVIRKAELVADFELAKQQLKDNLQRSFDALGKVPAVTLN